MALNPLRLPCWLAWYWPVAVEKEESKTLKVGAIAGAESQLVEAAAKVAKDKFGLDVEVVTFSDFATRTWP